MSKWDFRLPNDYARCVNDTCSVRLICLRYVKAGPKGCAPAVPEHVSMATFPGGPDCHGYIKEGEDSEA